MHKAQSSFEFLLLIGVVFVGVILIIGATYQDIAATTQKKEFLLVQDVAYVVQNELVLAAQVEDGYHRSFLLPALLNGRTYSATIVGNSVTISTQKATYSVRIPSVQGSLAKGMNNITKEDNIVVLNG